MYDPYNENEQGDPHRYHQVDGQDQRVVETVTIHAGACNGLEACDSKPKSAQDMLTILSLPPVHQHDGNDWSKG